MTVFLLLTTSLCSVQLSTTGVVSSVYEQDVGYQDSIIIHGFYIRLRYVFTTSLLHRPPAQHQFFHIRLILPIGLSLHC